MTSSAQIKNIKLQIVTDIKVNIFSSSLLGFRTWLGDGTLIYQRKFRKWHTIRIVRAFPLTSHRLRFHTTQPPPALKRGGGIEILKLRITKESWSKSLRHQVFPGGPPSKYYPGPTLLNFRDQTRTGVFNVVWS